MPLVCYYNLWHEYIELFSQVIILVELYQIAMPIHDNMGFIKEKLNKFLSFFQTAVQNLSRPPRV
jgi:hypothetical protein